MHEGHQRGQLALMLPNIGPNMLAADIIIVLGELRLAKRSEDPFGLHTHQSFVILYLNYAEFISLTYLCSGLRFIAIYFARF